MNWFKQSQSNKIASILFSIEGSFNISQPKTIGDISYDLCNFVFYDIGYKDKLGSSFHDFDVDGDTSIFGETGIINIYLNKPEEKVRPILQNIIDLYNKQNISIVMLKFLRIDESGMMKGRKVARIAVAVNNTNKLEKIPEMNLSNENAKDLIEILKFYGVQINGDAVYGYINSESLENFIDSIDDEFLHSYTQEDAIEENMISFGRTLEQMKNYLSILREMIYYINRNNLPNRNIQYN